MSIVNIVAIVPWIVILILGLAYFRPIVSILKRLDRAKLSSSGVEIETQDQLSAIANQGRQVTDVLKDISNQIERLVNQEKPYADYSDALKDAEKCIVSCINERIRTETILSEENIIEIKVIAVAMTFSWVFIRDRLRKILSNYPGASVNVKLAFVEYTYLKSLDLEDFDINWADESKQREKDINNFLKGLSEEMKKRLNIELSLYKNLPHWHGLLINDEYLFLGRTNILSFRDKPKLTVGQNKYRYFDTCSNVGVERIELFRNWHRYYTRRNGAETVSAP